MERGTKKNFLLREIGDMFDLWKRVRADRKDAIDNLREQLDLPRMTYAQLEGVHNLLLVMSPILRDRKEKQ